MKLIKPSVEYIPQESGLDGMYKQIERCGRLCYKSEDKITEDSAHKFVDGLIKAGHLAMLEHGTVYLDARQMHFDKERMYNENPYSTWEYHNPFITTNMRVLVENNWLDDLQHVCEPTEYHKKRYTMKFICDRGVSHELVRHKLLCAA